MKFTNEEKWIIGVPFLTGFGLCVMIMPALLADRSNNLAWLLLWIVGALVFGVVGVALKRWIDS